MSLTCASDVSTAIEPHPRCVWLHRYSLILVALTFLLIIAGGNVTTKGAGLAVPDWPLSFGSVNPDGWVHQPQVRDEHGHRLIGATVGLVTIGLVVWLRKVESRGWVKGMGYAALAAVIVQGVMGGLRVTEKSLVLAIIHGCFAQAFFCLTIAISLATSPKFAGGGGLASGDPARNRALRFWTTALVHSVFVQLILGALLRHLGGTHATVAHVFGAMLVGATLIMAAQHIFSRPESESPLARWAIGLILLYGLQLVFGIVTYLLVNPLGPRHAVNFMQRSFPTLHVAVGAFILGLSFTLAFKTRHLLGGQRDEATSVEGVPA